jgi:polyferredoxin
LLKVNRTYLRRFRHVVQWTVLFVVVHAGYNLYRFAKALEQGVIPSVSRPPSVEGFLPIGGLMALKLWITKGIFDTIHPASIVILCGALLLSLLMRKSFCSWICPIGTLSEAVWQFGSRIFGRNYTIPKYADYLLRSIKYILMSFFLYIILIKMSPSEIAGFLETPYWRVIDLKMLKFFTEISMTTTVVLGVIVILSLLYKNFWCRYCCPYGALLGLMGCISPIGITRYDEFCIHCNSCTRNCPSLLAVSKRDSILSPECSGCLTCVSSCHSQGALEVTLKGRKKINPAIVGISIIVIFFGLILIAQLNGKWNSSISYNELRILLSDTTPISHP